MDCGDSLGRRGRRIATGLHDPAQADRIGRTKVFLWHADQFIEVDRRQVQAGVAAAEAAAPGASSPCPTPAGLANIRFLTSWICPRSAYSWSV
jgi:hypothetical protein